MIFAIALFLATSTLAPLTFGAEDGENQGSNVDTGDMQGIKCTGSLQWFFPFRSIFSSSVFVMQIIKNMHIQQIPTLILKTSKFGIVQPSLIAPFP